MIKNIENEINEEEEKNMLEAFVDRFLEEGRKEGIKESLSQVAINMLKEKCDKALIKKYTGLSDAKIAKLEKTLQSV